MGSPLDDVNVLLASAFDGLAVNVYPYDVDTPQAPCVEIIGPTEGDLLAVMGASYGATPHGVPVRYTVRCQVLRTDPSSARRALNEFILGATSVPHLLDSLSDSAVTAAGVDADGWPRPVRFETSFETTSEHVHASVEFEVEVML